MDKRMSDADAGDELWSTTRAVGTKGESLYHTIPAEVAGILSLSSDSTVEVHVFDDGYWVERKDE